MSRATNSRVVLVLAVFLLLVGCGAYPLTERVPVTEAEILGSWSHEFEDGPPAAITLSVGGGVALVDMPRVVFASQQEAEEQSEIDWSERVTVEGDWSHLNDPSDAQYPSVVLTLPGTSTRPLFSGSITSQTH